jgi:hypothetical protein
MDVLINYTVVIIAQCVCILNYQVVHLERTTLFVNYTPNTAGKHDQQMKRRILGGEWKKVYTIG